MSLNLLDLNSIIDDDINEFGMLETQFGGSNRGYEIIAKNTNFSDKWQARETKFLIKFFDIHQNFFNANDLVINVFAKLYDEITKVCRAKDKIRIVFNHPDLMYPISSPFFSIASLSPHFMINMIERVCQSRRELKIEEDLEADFLIIHMPFGAGPVSPIDSFISKRKSIKIIYNNDQLCALRAVLVSKAFYDKDPKRNELCKINSIELNKRTLELLRATKLEPEEFGIDKFKVIEEYLKDYQITVINGNSKTNEPIFVGNSNKKHLYIWYINKHYNSITSMNSFLNRTYYCHDCKVGYNDLTSHYCKIICQLCRRPNCKENGKKFECEFCCKWCNNFFCRKTHIEKFCIATHKCSKCNSNHNKLFICDSNCKWCKNCKKVVERDTHRCFILKESEKNKINSKFLGLIFFDYECQQENLIHEPNLILAKPVCHHFLDLDGD